MMTETLANIHLNKQKENRRERSSNGTLPKVNSTAAMFQLKQENVKRTGSFVIGQKLRESKWFTHVEMNVFCAVVESGFIVEQKENDSDVIKHGVAIWAPNFGKFALFILILVALFGFFL